LKKCVAKESRAFRELREKGFAIRKPYPEGGIQQGGELTRILEGKERELI